LATGGGERTAHAPGLGGPSWARRAAGVGALVVAAAFGAGAFAAVHGDDSRGSSAGVPAAVAVPPPGARRELLAEAAKRRRIRALRPSDRLRWPVKGAVTGTFGELRAGHPHEGIDIPMPAGTPIKAAASGRVIMRELQQGYGKYTCIAHETITTCYGHQSRFGTAVGARVRRGEVIGYVGNTGDTTAYHLHFEVRRGTKPWGTPVDPAKFLPRRP
jgi:murein DD-endopeptidase MepM/ murein hydrolase activator NlpD